MKLGRSLALVLITWLPLGVGCAPNESTAGQLLKCQGGACQPVSDTDDDDDGACFDIDVDGDGSPHDDAPPAGGEQPVIPSGLGHDDDGDGDDDDDDDGVCDSEDDDDDGDGIPDEDDCDEQPGGDDDGSDDDDDDDATPDLP